MKLYKGNGQPHFGPSLLRIPPSASPKLDHGVKRYGPQSDPLRLHGSTSVGTPTTFSNDPVTVRELLLIVSSLYGSMLTGKPPFEVPLPGQDARCRVISVEKRLVDVVRHWNMDMSPEVRWAT